MREQSHLEKQLFVIGCVLFWLLVGIAAVLKLGWLDRLPQIPCMFVLVFGMYCPGCGGTRALSALLSGHPLQSFLYHPAVDYVGILCGWFMVSQTIERVSQGRIRIGMKYHDYYLWILLAILILHCGIRNILKLLWGIEIPA